MTKKVINTDVVKKGDNKILLMKLLRENGKTKLYLKTAPEVEAVFRTEQTTVSTVYKDEDTFHNFYKQLSNEDNLVNLVDNVRLNSYGTQLFDGYRKNLSLLRTVGISNGILFEIQGLIGEEMLEEWSRTLKEFILKLYKSYVRPVEITLILEKKEVC